MRVASTVHRQPANLLSAQVHADAPDGGLGIHADPAAEHVHRGILPLGPGVDGQMRLGKQHDTAGPDGIEAVELAAKYSPASSPSSLFE